MNILVMISDTEYLNDDIYNIWADELSFCLTIIREKKISSYCDETSYDGIIISDMLIKYDDIYNRLLDKNIPIVCIGENKIKNIKDKSYKIWGRGDKNIRWALRYLYAQLNYDYQNIFYDMQKLLPAQLFTQNNYADMCDDKPLVVVFHGGFLRPNYTLDLTMDLSHHLSDIWNYDVLNIEYIFNNKDITIENIYNQMIILSQYLSRLGRFVILCGHSAGAVPAMLLGNILQKRISSIRFLTLLLSPFYDITDKYIIDDKQIYTYLQGISDRFIFDNLVRHISKQEFYLVHGINDDTISDYSSRKLADILSHQNIVHLHIIPDISHMSITRKTGLYSEKMYNILQVIKNRTQICTP
jgi:pimeloyl-ACP methyl ester carboxylesterase